MTKQELIESLQKDFETQTVSHYLEGLPKPVIQLYSYLDKKVTHETNSVGMDMKFSSFVTKKVYDFFHYAYRAINGPQYGDNNMDYKAMFIKLFSDDTLLDKIESMPDQYRMLLKNGGFLSIDTNQYTGKISRIVFHFPQIYSGLEANVERYLKALEIPENQRTPEDTNYIDTMAKFINKRMKFPKTYKSQDGKYGTGDKIKGGLSDKLTLEQIAEKHGVSLEEITSEHEKGIKIESEHTSDPSVAAEIAKDHLVESAMYYTDLAKTESTEKKSNTKKYDLGFGTMGNGTTVWNRARMVNGDYPTIAHISNNGIVTYRKELPESVKAEIEQFAKKEVYKTKESKFKEGDNVQYIEGDLEKYTWYGVVKKVVDLDTEYAYRIDAYSKQGDVIMFDSEKTNEKYEAVLKQSRGEMFTLLSAQYKNQTNNTLSEKINKLWSGFYNEFTENKLYKKNLRMKSEEMANAFISDFETSDYKHYFTVNKDRLDGKIVNIKFVPDTKSKNTTEDLHDKYKSLEDQNDHTEAVKLLIEHYGTETEMDVIKAIEARQAKQGSISPEDKSIRDEIGNKYHKKLKADMTKKTDTKTDKWGYVYSKMPEVAAVYSIGKSQTDRVVIKHKGQAFVIYADIRGVRREKDITWVGEAMDWLKDVLTTMADFTSGKGITNEDVLSRLTLRYGKDLLNDKSKKVEVEEKTTGPFYIEYLNKEKGFKPDKKYFDSSAEATAWARSNFDKFDPDMIRYTETKQEPVQLTPDFTWKAPKEGQLFMLSGVEMKCYNVDENGIDYGPSNKTQAEISSMWTVFYPVFAWGFKRVIENNRHFLVKGDIKVHTQELMKMYGYKDELAANADIYKNIVVSEPKSKPETKHEEFEGASTGTGALYEFFTPDLAVKKMWQLIYEAGFKSGNILEPALGSGRLLKYAPQGCNLTAFEISAENADLSRTVLSPYFGKTEIYNQSFETAYLQPDRFNSKYKGGVTWLDQYPFDLVIANPPYGKFTGLYKTHFKFSGQFEHFFIEYTMKLVKSGGIGAFIVPSSFMRNGNTYNDVKERIFKDSSLVDAYRLPNNIFKKTQIGTDIIILKKK